MAPIRNGKKKCVTMKIFGREELKNLLEIEANLNDRERTISLGEVVNSRYPEVVKLFSASVNGFGVSEITQSNYAQCKLCGELLVWSGGNVRRHCIERCPERKDKIVDGSTSSDPHQSRVTDFVAKKLNASQVVGITEEIIKYCVNTARSFNHMSDDNFKSLIAGVVHVSNSQYPISTVKEALPDRKTISRKCKLEAEKRLENMYEKVKLKFDNQRVTLAIDFGRHHGVDFLSVCATYLDDLDWKLRVVPLGFLPCYTDTKNHEQVYAMLERLGHQIGILPDVLRMSYVCADGGSNLKKCAETRFKGYIRCANHGIHKIAERSFDWYKDDENKFTEEERKEITNLAALLEDCRTLAIVIRGTKEIRNTLNSLPNAGVPTRWLSFLSCLEDILPLLPLCAFHEATKVSAARLLSNQMKLSSIQFVLKPLKDWNLVFQTEDVSIHMVAPLYRTLLQEYGSQRDGRMIPKNQNNFDLDTIKLLAKSANFAVQRQYRELHDVHLAAAFLNPGTKRMKAFDQSEYNKARLFVDELLEPSSRNLTRPPSRGTPNSSLCVIASQRLADDDSDVEPESELTEYINDSVDKGETLDAYWIRKKNTWPDLYEVAVKLFGIIPSEAACERAFSHSGRVFDKLRTSLDPEHVDWIVTTSLLNKSKLSFYCFIFFGFMSYLVDLLF